MRSSKKEMLVLLLFSALSLAPSQGVGATIFDNGLPAPSFGGIQMTTQLLAEDFPINTPVRLTHLRFWSLEARGTTVYQGTIYWAFHANTAANLPTMTPVASGLAVLPNKVATGRTAVIAGFTFDEFQYDVALPNVLLDLGSWWVALHHGPLSFVVVDQFSWQQTISNATSGTAVGSPVQNTGVPWSRSNTHSAFQLGGELAPEAIIASVQGLSLSDGENNSLIGKLQAAQASLASGNSNAARGQLMAFINEIRALEQSERLNSQTASSMIASAEAILAGL